MISNLEVKVEQNKGVSFLKDAYVTQPFRIVPVGQYKKDKAAYLMIMSSSPGLLDGDNHIIKINVGRAAGLQLQTQAYQRLFHMRESASQSTYIELEDDAIFSYVPHPIVPQKSSRFLSYTQVKLKNNCHLLLSEILTCGRKHSREVFEYKSFQNLTEVYFNDQLVIKDNVLLDTQQMPIEGLTFLEGYTHQGSLIYTNTANIKIGQFIEFFYEKYHQLEDVQFGISELENNGFLVRLLGTGAEKLHLIFKDIQEKIWHELMLPHTK